MPVHLSSTKEYLLSIIIVSFNTADLTIQTLASALTDINTSPMLKNKTQFIIVDNASTDSSIKKLKAFCQTLPATVAQQIQIIKNTQNAGFAKANNQGMTASSARYLLLLNSDTIVHKGSLSKMVAVFEQSPINELTAHTQRSKHTDRLGILAATLLNPDQTPQPQGGNLPTLMTALSHLLLLDDLPVIGRFFRSTQFTGKSQSVSQPKTELQTIGWVGGTAMMIRKEVLEEVGLLDESIFMYSEDIEFCLRAAQHHWDRAILHSAPITHFGSASSTSGNAILGELKGYIYIWSKHKPQWQQPLLKLILKIGVLLRIVIFGTMVANPAKVSIYKKAWKLLNYAY